MTDEPNKQPPNVSFVDNPHAPEVFADRASGFFHLNGNIRITFESARINHATDPGPVNRVVIGRLAMPFAEAEAFARSLLAFCEGQRQNPQPTAQGTPTIQ